MTGSLAGRVGLITGFSRSTGIAAATADRLLSAGASLVVSGWEAYDADAERGADPDGGTALASRLDPSGEMLLHCEADLDEVDSADRLVRTAVERFGRIDFLVAAHARDGAGRLLDVTPELLDRCWTTNARGSLLLAQAFARARPTPQAPVGRIVLFTSGQHLGPMAGELAYAVSKGAIHQMTRSLAAEFADRGTNVNCVNPGPVDTGWAAPSLISELAPNFARGRWGSPQDTAKVVEWLVGDDSEWVTGQVIDCEGGFRLTPRPTD